MEGYQQWLMGKKLTLNTVSCYMRSLRSLLSCADLSKPVTDIFKNVYTGYGKTEKRALPLEDLHKLCQLSLTHEQDLQKARDLFLFSVCTLGMPFIDIAFLCKNQIKEGYITYNRHKTGQRIRVKIEECTQKIINRYNSKDSKYVFPILQQGTMHEYQVMRSRYNRQLRRLGRMAGLSRCLTSYVARHSWASMAYHQNVDLPVISKALGHTSPQTTLTYIREIDDDRIDCANHKLVEQLTERGIKG